MENYALKILQEKVNEINYYIKLIKQHEPIDYKFSLDYINLVKKRIHLQRVIAIIKVMNLSVEIE